MKKELSSMFWETSHKDLDRKINDLESKVASSITFWGNYDRDKINDAIELAKEIQADFKKKIRYPSKIERDEAWQRFFNLREKAYQIKHQAIEDLSNEHYKEINGYLIDADYSKLGDVILTVLTIGLLSITKEDMIWKGKQLREAGQLFKQYKYEMTKDHKAEIHERIVSIREDHDNYWQVYRDYQEEKQKIYEEKKQAWEERQTRREQAKERIEANIEKNRENLRKAEEALERQKQRRSDLEDQISSAWSDSFRERAEGWLDECNNKISDIEDSIDRLEGWIREGEDKLSSFY